jgi:hypothetical protein
LGIAEGRPILFGTRKHWEGDNGTIDYAGSVNAVADIMKRAIYQDQSKEELRQAIDGYLQINSGTQFAGAYWNYAK